MVTEVRSAEERRKAILDNAAIMGIDEEYISELVETFYERIRAHSELGPIFDKVIGDNWGPHLARMKNFWASVALNAGLYSGKPVPKHQKLSNVTPEHFETWLSLFHQTLNDTAPSPAAVIYFMERAERIANSLQLAMFGLPSLNGATPDR